MLHGMSASTSQPAAAATAAHRSRQAQLIEDEIRRLQDQLREVQAKDNEAEQCERKSKRTREHENTAFFPLARGVASGKLPDEATGADAVPHQLGSGRLAESIEKESSSFSSMAHRSSIAKAPDESASTGALQVPWLLQRTSEHKDFRSRMQVGKQQRQEDFQDPVEYEADLVLNKWSNQQRRKQHTPMLALPSTGPPSPRAVPVAGKSVRPLLTDVLEGSWVSPAQIDWSKETPEEIPRTPDWRKRSRSIKPMLKEDASDSTLFQRRMELLGLPGEQRTSSQQPLRASQAFDAGAAEKPAGNAVSHFNFANPPQRSIRDDLKHAGQGYSQRHRHADVSRWQAPAEEQKSAETSTDKELRAQADIPQLRDERSSAGLPHSPIRDEMPRFGRRRDGLLDNMPEDSQDKSSLAANKSTSAPCAKDAADTDAGLVPGRAMDANDGVDDADDTSEERWRKRCKVLEAQLAAAKGQERPPSPCEQQLDSERHQKTAELPTEKQQPAQPPAAVQMPPRNPQEQLASSLPAVPPQRDRELLPLPSQEPSTSRKADGQCLQQ